jgi:hypothetical protein
MPISNNTFLLLEHLPITFENKYPLSGETSITKMMTVLIKPPGEFIPKRNPKRPSAPPNSLLKLWFSKLS